MKELNDMSDEELKVELKKRYEHDRDAYTESKTEFITSIVQLARKR